MTFRIADTFTDSLARLTAQEQKAVKTTAFDLQMDASAPGLSFHKLDRAKDPRFWSVRVNADIRIIVHRDAGSILLAYVDHHDKAYAWAERRKIERHPTTGAMQIVEVIERTEAVARPAAPAPAPKAAPAKPKLFDNLRKLELLGFGVPEEWVEAVRSCDEDTVLDVLKHLPSEAREALLRLAVGEQPEVKPPAPPDADPYEHPDAARRFRLVTSTEELERALAFPWAKWIVFLHPAQQELVRRSYGGPARVTGSAGTGKTIVALHRAVQLARIGPATRVLLTTYSKPLANALKGRLDLLASGEPEIAQRITVKAITAVGYDLYSQAFGQPTIASAANVEAALREGAKAVPDHGFTRTFLAAEWADVVDAWQLRTFEAYAGVQRLGRKTRLGAKQRETLWAIFEHARAFLAERKLVTWSDVFGRLAERLEAGAQPPFTHAVVDEAQDLGVAELRFLAALAGGRPDSLFFAGDIGQRIFQQPFSWKALGVDVRGRSAVLRINYRTSGAIRAEADKLLPRTVADVDGNAEDRRGTVSVFDGPPPGVSLYDDTADEVAGVAAWLRQRCAEGLAPHEIGVFVRSEAEIKRGREAIKAAGLPLVELNDKIETAEGYVALGTMHLAKGLEFRAVAVMACDEDVLPLQERIEAVGDEADLAEVYDTERHLLYVACTRAREHLLVTGIEPGSEFLGDMGGG